MCLSNLFLKILKTLSTAADDGAKDTRCDTRSPHVGMPKGWWASQKDKIATPTFSWSLCLHTLTCAGFGGWVKGSRDHLAGWSRFLPHSVITRALCVTSDKQVMQWMNNSLEAILETLPLHVDLLNNIAAGLFRLEYFNSQGLRAQHIPDRHCRIDLLEHADKYQVDDNNSVEILMGIRAYLQSYTIKLPNLPFFSPVSRTHYLLCPELINPRAPDSFYNRERVQLVDSKPAPTPMNPPAGNRNKDSYENEHGQLKSVLCIFSQPHSLNYNWVPPCKVKHLVQVAQWFCFSAKPQQENFQVLASSFSVFHEKIYKFKVNIGAHNPVNVLSWTCP